MISSQFIFRKNNPSFEHVH